MSVPAAEETYDTWQLADAPEPDSMHDKLAVSAPLTVTVTNPVGVIAVPGELSVTTMVRVTVPPTVTEAGAVRVIIVDRKLTVTVSLPHALLAELLLASPL